MSVFDDIAKWVENKPMVIIHLDESYSESLINSKNGKEKFTFSQPHSVFDGIKLPTLCLVEIYDRQNPQCLLGVIKSKSAITTFDTRVTIANLLEVNIYSLDELLSKIHEPKYAKQFREILSDRYFVKRLTPKLSSHIIYILSQDENNWNALETASLNLSGLRNVSNNYWAQGDAIKLAVAVLGLDKSAIPLEASVRKNKYSALSFKDARILEDNVINMDSSIIPEFKLIEKDMTGRAVFENRGERLVVYTANRGPLEKMLGVDLIYINETLGNIVMIQYKMLEKERGEYGKENDWIFRLDKQTMTEMSRMRLPAIDGQVDDYRLNRDPFFFKFVKRIVKSEQQKSIILSLKHLNQILKSRNAKGVRGGIRLSYRSLKGAYLRENDIISLIRSGYVGTHRIETEVLKKFIPQVAEGKKAFVIAWQRNILQDDRTA